MARVSLIIPALNEAESIGKSLDLILEKNKAGNFEVIVVDNGSTDNTSAIARQHGAIVVAQPARGYGNALRKGFESATGEIMVMGDADLTYPLENYLDFIKPLMDRRADFVIGNRYKWSNRRSFGLLNFSGGLMLTFLGNILYFSWIKDWHCGMRAFSRKAYAIMDLQSSGMALASEMVIKALTNEISIVQTDIVYRKRSGFSKLRIIKDGFSHLGLITNSWIGYKWKIAKNMVRRKI